MALYSYKALTAGGKTERGTLNAASENEARSTLQGRNVFPLEIRPSRPFQFSLGSLFNLSREPRLPVQGVASFARQFATLLDATIPYDSALDMILDQTKDIAFKAVLSDVRGRVVEGAYLADAFGRYPLMFPPMVVNMVRSGEASGTLPLIMHRLADYYENVSRQRSKIASAMVYPAFMMVFGTGVVVFMLTSIIPKITALFDNFGAQLPLPTRFLIATSNILTGYWWLLLIMIFVAAWSLTHYLRTEKGKMARDRLELKIPFWKDLRQKVLLERFAQTLSTMLNSGVELKEALIVSKQVMENRLYLAAMENVTFDVQNKGLPLATAMRRTERFPEDMCQMIAIGEETASLAPMLDTVQNRLSREVNAMMDGATALFEPIMILGMGLVVGFIVVSILLPLLQLNQLVG